MARSRCTASSSVTVLGGDGVRRSLWSNVLGPISGSRYCTGWRRAASIPASEDEDARGVRCRSHRHSRQTTSQNPRFGDALIHAGANPECWPACAWLGLTRGEIACGLDYWDISEGTE